MTNLVFESPELAQWKEMAGFVTRPVEGHHSLAWLPVVFRQTVGPLDKSLLGLALVGCILPEGGWYSVAGSVSTTVHPTNPHDIKQKVLRTPSNYKCTWVSFHPFHSFRVGFYHIPYRHSQSARQMFCLG